MPGADAFPVRIAGSIPQSNLSEQVRDGGFKACRELFEHPQSGFSLPIFQFRDMNSSNPRHIGKLLLRPAMLLP